MDLCSKYRFSTPLRVIPTYSTICWQKMPPFCLDGYQNPQSCACVSDIYDNRLLRHCCCFTVGCPHLQWAFLFPCCVSLISHLQEQHNYTVLIIFG